MSLAFCWQVVPQAPQHFRSSEMKANWWGWGGEGGVEVGDIEITMTIIIHVSICLCVCLYVIWYGDASEK